jgi:hypothetical protein
MKSNITKPIKTTPKRLSDKYKGILSKKQGETKTSMSISSK